MKTISTLISLLFLSVMGFAQTTSNVTFQVDMNNYSGSFTTPEVNGDFNGWCGNCNAMTDANMDGIWEVTLPITADSIEFKYAHDSWTGQENLVPSLPCTKTTSGFTNRFMHLSGDTILPVVCWESCASCATVVTKNVTFQVDMNNYSGSFTTPEVNGDFNGWCGGCNTLTDANMDGIWEVTLPLTQDSIEFKFAYDSWTGQENFSGGESCTKTTGGFTNRFMHLTTDTVLPVVCWDSCSSCSPPLNQIDLPIDWEGSTTDYTVTDFGGTSSILVTDPAGGSNMVLQTLKDTGNAFWAGTTLSTPAGLASQIPFTTTDLTISVHVYSPDAGIPVRLKAEDHTSPTASVETEAMTTVANAWETLVFDFSNQVTGTAAFSADSTYDMLSIFYNFGTDGTTAGAKTYYCDSVYFGGAVPPPPATNDITFSVDMTQYGGSTANGVFLNGDFNGWCGSCNPMSDANMDGVWDVTITLPATPDSIQYKFTVDGWNDQENFTGGEPCTITENGFTNRLSVISSDTTLPTVCWNSCTSNCIPTGPGSNITFRVDMNDFTGAFTIPELNGDFNGWCGSCTPMTDADNDGVWEVTVNITADSIEWKFSADNWSVQENFAGGEPCTKTTSGFTNRFMQVAGDTTLPIVCWGSCNACTGTATTANVTFRVNMNEVDASTYTTPELNGTFNGWCGNCTPMTDADNDGIWEVSVVLPVDSTIEYKFSADAWTIQESLDAALPCVVVDGNFVNRFLQPTADTTLEIVCWNACQDCDNSIGDVNRIGLALYPNPANDFIQIEGDFSGSENYRIEFVNVLGKQMLTERLSPAGNNVISTSHLSQGIYLVSVYNGDSKIATQRVIVSH